MRKNNIIKSKLGFFYFFSQREDHYYIQSWNQNKNKGTSLWSYSLESIEGQGNIFRTHWSIPSNNITTWDLLGNKVSDKQAWQVVLRSQIAVSDCYLQGECESRCGVSNNNILLSKGPQRLFKTTQKIKKTAYLLTIEHNVMSRRHSQTIHTHSHTWHFTIVNDDGRREEFAKKLNQKAIQSSKYG